MGTSGSYTGGGGEAGNDLRDGISDWLDSLPTGPTEPEPTDLPPLQPDNVLPVIGLFPRGTGGGGDGPGGVGPGSHGGGDGRGGTSGGGAQRSSSASATSAGRAAAGAYAFRTGDVEALRELGLDYDDLRALDDPIEIARRIVDMACESSNGTIEDDERRQVAATVALWLLEADESGPPPDPDEIARQALTTILFEAMATESAAVLSDGRRPTWATREGERQMRETAEALAQRAELSPAGATAAEFARAIEQGLETLRSIWGEA